MGDSIVLSGARGGAVTLLGQAARLLVQFVGIIVLSRLLSPSDFGLIAMVAVFIGLGELIRDFGLPTAALQARRLTNGQASNFFWANTLLGALAAIALLAATPLVVGLYDQPALAAVMPTLALAPLLNGLQAQLQVRLARSRRFTAIAVTDLLAQVLGLGCAIMAAAGGLHYWALVIQTLTVASVLLLSRCVVSDWLPGIPRRRQGSRVQFVSGGNFGIAMLLTYAASNVDSLVLGANFGPTATGLYGRAFQLLSVPVNGLLNPLTQVIVPVINGARSGGRNPAEVLQRAQFALGLLVVWVYTVTAATADQLIPLVLGEQWRGAVVFFQILALGGAFQVFSFVSYWAFIVEDRSRELLHYNLVTKPLALVLILGGSLAGPEGVAWGYALSLIVSWPINLIWLSKIARYPGWSFLRGGLRILASACISFVTAYAVMTEINFASNWLQVLVGMAVASIVYFVVIAATPGGWRHLRPVLRIGALILRRGRI